MSKRKEKHKKKKNPVLKRNVRKYLWKYYRKEFDRQNIKYNSDEFNSRCDAVTFNFKEANKHNEKPLKTTIKNVKYFYRQLYKSDWGKNVWDKLGVIKSPKPDLSSLTNDDYVEGEMYHFYDIPNLIKLAPNFPDYIYLESKIIFGRKKYIQCGKPLDYQGSSMQDYVAFMNDVQDMVGKDSYNAERFVYIHHFKKDIKDYNNLDNKNKAKKREVWILHLEPCNAKGQPDTYGFEAKGDYIELSDEYFENARKEKKEERKIKKEETPITESGVLKEGQDIKIEEIKLQNKQDLVKDEIKYLQKRLNNDIAELKEMMKNKDISPKEYLEIKKDYNSQYDKQILELMK